jgi:hypothetical protein
MFSYYIYRKYTVWYVQNDDTNDKTFDTKEYNKNSFITSYVQVCYCYCDFFFFHIIIMFSMHIKESDV